MTHQPRQSRRSRVWMVAIGVSLCLFVATALSPWQGTASAATSEITAEALEAICGTLGQIAWAAYVAKDYALLAKVDATMEAIGCFD